MEDCFDVPTIDRILGKCVKKSILGRRQNGKKTFENKWFLEHDRREHYGFSFFHMLSGGRDFQKNQALKYTQDFTRF